MRVSFATLRVLSECGDVEAFMALKDIGRFHEVYGAEFQPMANGSRIFAEFVVRDFPESPHEKMQRNNAGKRVYCNCKSCCDWRAEEMAKAKLLRVQGWRAG